jgi:hypothetical protein
MNSSEIDPQNADIFSERKEHFNTKSLLAVGLADERQLNLCVNVVIKEIISLFNNENLANEFFTQSMDKLLGEVYSHKTLDNPTRDDITAAHEADVHVIIVKRFSHDIPDFAASKDYTVIDFNHVRGTPQDINVINYIKTITDKLVALDEAEEPVYFVVFVPYPYVTEDIIQELSEAQPEINVVRRMDGEYIGHCYIWTGSTVLYHILTNTNPDGSERVEYITDPKWERPEELPLDRTEAHRFIQNTIAEMKEEFKDDPAVLQETLDDIASRYAEPKIVVPKAPIMQFPSFEFTEEQKKSNFTHLQKISTPSKFLYAKTPSELAETSKFLASTENTTKYASNPAAWIEQETKNIDESRRSIMGSSYIALPSDWDPEWNVNGPPIFIPDNFIPPKYGGVQIRRSFVRESKPGEDIHVLRCSNVPSWVTENILLGIFSKYNTETRQAVIIENGVSVTITYPRIRFSVNEKQSKTDAWGGKTKMATVTFSNAGDHIFDAPFALLSLA